VLYFGAVVRRNSLIGGSAWWIANEHKKIVTYGSIYVHQTFPSLIRLEYEALLNGLRAVCLNDFGRVLIMGSSKMVVHHIQQEFHSDFQFIQTVFDQVKDLVEAIQKVLLKLQHISVELITHEANSYAHVLAEKAIVKYEKRRHAIMSKQFAESQLPPSPLGSQQSLQQFFEVEDSRTTSVKGVDYLL
jgi:ribonuclease HI